MLLQWKLLQLEDEPEQGSKMLHIRLQLAMPVLVHELVVLAEKPRMGLCPLRALLQEPPQVMPEKPVP